MGWWDDELEALAQQVIACGRESELGAAMARAGKAAIGDEGRPVDVFGHAGTVASGSALAQALKVELRRLLVVQ